MEETVVQRPDIDIEEDLREFARSYDPLKQARGHFECIVKDGHVTLTGNVRTMQARRVLVDNVPDIEGVVSMDESAFFDDETLRIELGKVLPQGVYVRLNYGSVVVTFTEERKDSEKVLDKIKKIPGIRADKVVQEAL